VLAIAEAAARLRTTPRMLRYRESLGLLPPGRVRRGAHRRYGEDELRAASYAMALETHYGVSPRALAFALRTLAEPGVRDDVRRLGELTGRVRPLAALDFEQEKARRLLQRR